MNSALRDQVMALPVEEKFDLMMASFDSLPEDALPVFDDSRIASLEMLVERFRNYPEPTVQYDKVVERLRCHSQLYAGRS